MQSFSFPAVCWEAYLLQLSDTPPGGPLGILKDAFIRFFFAASAEILLKFLRRSTSRQLQSIGYNFCSFVKEQSFVSVTTETVLTLNGLPL